VPGDASQSKELDGSFGLEQPMKNSAANAIVYEAL
jgi:hypothetical protein